MDDVCLDLITKKYCASFLTRLDFDRGNKSFSNMESYIQILFNVKIILSVEKRLGLRSCFYLDVIHLVILRMNTWLSSQYLLGYDWKSHHIDADA